MTENARNKLKKIIHFCKSFGYADHDNISQCIRATLDDAPDKVISFIDLIWKVLKGLDRREKKEVIVEGIQILSSTLSLLGFHIPMMSIASNVVSLGGYLLKIVFSLTDFESVLKTKNKALDTIQHELAGLAARLERTEKFIDLVDSQECTGKYTLKMLRNDIDMQIGVEQIGNLKSRIKSLMSGKMEDWFTALELIKLFVRISTLRHSLLIRILTCLKSNNFIPATDTAIQKHIKEERRENQRFLSSFFSVPSLETVGILAIYDPTKEDEIDAYIKDMGLSYQNLRATLHDKVVQLIPFSNTSIVCGRPIFSFWSVRSMKRSWNASNVRKDFRFTAIKDTFNLFYIQSPDFDEYVYMKENNYCKYKNIFYVPDNAHWRVILVYDMAGVHQPQFEFRCILSTKKWPDKFLYIEKSYFECAKGLEKNSKLSIDCLFTLRETYPLRSFFKKTEHGGAEIILPHDSPISVPTMTPLGTLTDDEIDDEYTEISNQNAGSYTEEKIQNSIVSIQSFIDERIVNVKKDIDRIAKFISEKKDQELCSYLKKIAAIIPCLAGDCFTDSTMEGVLEMISINFELFQEDFKFDSVLRQMLRVCGLVLSCIWKIDDINSYVTHDLKQDDTHRLHIEKDLRSIRRFEISLNQIECAENIMERDIREMKSDGEFCKELKCLAKLREKVKSDPRLLVTSVKISILQLAVLWQMYAVAKCPGHSNITANTLRYTLLLHKNDEKSFLKSIFECCLPVDDSVNVTLFHKYVACIDC